MIEEVVKAAKKYMPALDQKRIQEAYEFAKKAHEGQYRKSGCPYIVHPVSAAMILTDLHVDEDTLIAALLHDVPEDTPYSIGDLERRFGKTVAFLVSGITKLSKVHYREDMMERQIESLKKLFIHSAQDPRIILIKLADRLHNMQTIDSIQSPEKRVRIARETLEIFVPIANLLGIWELKNQLEDCCFNALRPKDFANIDELIRNSKIKKSNLVKKTIKEIGGLMKKKGLENALIEGRYKTHYSTFRKMMTSGKSFDEIYDLVGIRIIVEDVETCYRVLGILHQNYTPKVGRLKDYIAIPKTNGYQSIHTTVFGVKGAPTEFQVRTYDMHLENEYGVAAHYFYREGQKRKRQLMKRNLRKKYKWVQEILDLQKQSKDNQSFLTHLKLDIFTDRIFVFTPKGDVIDLPKDATVIDFAYTIHSEVGMLATSASINGKAKPITSRLKNGDVVLVETSEEAEGPQVEWLDVVQTNLAKQRIREYLRERDHTELLAQSEKLLDDKLQMFGFQGTKALSKDQKILLLDKFGIESWEDLLAEIGSGILDSRDVVQVLYSEQEIFGEASEPVNLAAYHEISHKPLKQIPPEKVHKVSLMLEVANKIGMLGQLCNEIAEIDLNIARVTTNPDAGSAETIEVEFVVEIRGFEEYERLMKTIQKVDGVKNVVRLRRGLLAARDAADFHIEHAQQPLL